MAYAKEYRAKNKELIKLKNRKWYEQHPQWKADWREKNKDRANESARNWAKNKRKIDPEFRLKITLRNRINNILYTKGKHGKYVELLGCDFKRYKEYLENKFLDGMSWDNHGKWHIDHILPCVSFDLTKEEEQRKCFHYSNTQPIWAIDNLKKGVLVG